MVCGGWLRCVRYMSGMRRSPRTVAKFNRPRLRCFIGNIKPSEDALPHEMQVGAWWNIIRGPPIRMSGFVSSEPATVVRLWLSVAEQAGQSLYDHLQAILLCARHETCFSGHPESPHPYFFFSLPCAPFTRPASHYRLFPIQSPDTHAH